MGGDVRTQFPLVHSYHIACIRFTFYSVEQNEIGLQLNTLDKNSWKRLVIIGAFSMQSLVAVAQGAWMHKDDVYDVIEECRPNYSMSEIKDNPELKLKVVCEDKCIQSKLNEWFAKSDENKDTYFRVSDVYIVERSAGLASCRNQSRNPEQSNCLAQWSPDIIAKIGPPGCDFRVECEANFDIDDNGSPTNTTAKCQEGPAKSEFERETLCLLGNMKFQGHRGRKNVTQPFELTEPQSCATS